MINCYHITVIIVTTITAILKRNKTLTESSEAATTSS